MKEFYYAQEDTFRTKCKEMMVMAHRQFFKDEGHIKDKNQQWISYTS